MTLSSALLLFLLAVGWLWYKNQLTTSIVLCSIFLTGTSYIRFISLQKQFTYSQTLTEAKLAGYGYITDISPNQRKPKTATFAMYPYNKHSKILCHTRIPQTLDIKPDDIIFIKHLSIPKATTNSFAWFLARNELSGYIHKPPYIQVLHRPRWSLRRMLCNTRNTLISYIYHYLPQKHADITSHIFFGYKATSLDMRNQFQKWGIAHLLARSGLHLVIFSGCFMWILGYIPLHYTIRYAVIIILISLYAVISWPTISFNRALAMLYAFYICQYARIRYHAIHWVICTAVITLCWNPMHLFFLDFQLSFSLTYTLCWVFTYAIPSKYQQETLA